MRPLADYTQGRDNNFNLLRMLAASMVIYAHSYPLLQGYAGGRPNWTGDRLFDLMGIDSGRIGVQIFFVMSGFLVAQSLSRRPSLVEFFGARALRILPALVAAILACGLLFGLAFSALPAHEYLASPGLWQYFWTNFSLQMTAQQPLPGVFEANPYARVVNGSLWTIPWEMKMYLSLGLLAAIGIFARRRMVAAGFAVLFAAFCLVRLGMFPELMGRSLLLGFAVFFYAGVMLWLFRERVPMSGATLAGACALLVAMAFLYRNSDWVRAFYPLLLAFVVIGVAYVPAGPIRRYNRIGDYSYGVYLYAFPAQQALVALFPQLSALQLTGYGLIAALTFAVPSWHLLEKPMLSLKSRLRAIETRPPLAAESPGRHA
jgi:peptidoglycan/LPS O-acetylase OafA/YrhL